MMDPIKNRERLFRENDVPFGEFMVKEKSVWFSQIELAQTRKALRLSQASSVLDAGCSDGRLLAYLDGKGGCGPRFGIDFARSPLKGLRRKDPSIHAACADICQLPFVDGAFDAVACLGVFHHVPTEQDRQNVLREFYRCLVPGGRCVMAVLNRRTWAPLVANGKEGTLTTAPDLYVYLYDPDELAAVMTRHGFAVERVDAINVLPTRYLKILRSFGGSLDTMLSRYCPSLALSKARSLFIACHKK